MSADPTSPSSPEPASPTPGEMPAETLPQKRRHRKPDSAAAAPDTGGDPDNEIIVLSSLLQSLLARKQGTEPGDAVETETRGKINRFVSRKDAPGVPATASPATASPDASTSNAEPVPPVPAGAPEETAVSSRPLVAGPEGMAAIAFPKFEPRAFQADPADAWGQRNGSTWGRGVLYFTFAAGIALLAFLAGRSEARHGEAANKSVAALPATDWTPAAIEQLDRALAADQRGDLATARRLTSELEKTTKSSAVLDAYSATIDTRLGRLNDVEATLSRRLGPNTPPEVSAALYEAQGFNYARRREFDHAADSFAAVANVRPFDAANFLHLGEVQRRLGRLTDAVDTFQRALLRLPAASPNTAGEREYVEFKQRLSLVELGREAELKAELDRRLNLPAPSGYWLLTGAAAALQKSDLPTAVDLLKKAQVVLTPAYFNPLMEDYFFRAFAYHPEMNPFLASVTPETLGARRLQMQYFVDP